MNSVLSPYQMVVILALCVWVIPLILIWVRFDGLPHAAQLFISILAAPLMMTDDFVRAFELADSVPFLIGAFTFVPVLIAVQLYIAMHKLLLEKPAMRLLHYGVVLFLVAAQIPFLLLPAEIKLAILENPVMGDMFANWPLYAFYLLASAAILFYAVKVEDMLRKYQHHLSEHVVDINFYKYPYAVAMFSGLISVGFGAIIIVMLVAFDVVLIPYWQSIIAVLYCFVTCLIVMSLLEKRRFAPSPLDYSKLENNPYSEEHLKEVLAKAEQSIIRLKAYKKIGLKLRQLADAAGVEPMELAVATRVVLNRNFRAFIYHYRLEYAKRLLMRTDIKVSTVAKKLGFDSEKYLSGMFVKYIQAMGRSPDDDIPDNP